MNCPQARKLVKNMEKLSDNQQNKISFTKEQFESLLKLVYLGEWMINANRVDDRIKKYEDLQDYIFSYAKQFGLDEFVDDEEAKKGKFFPTRKFEEETDVQKFIKEYDEETFWDEIVDRLGERDFYRHYAKDEIQKMSQDERFEKAYEFIDKWGEKINRNGIEGLEIKN